MSEQEFVSHLAAISRVHLGDSFEISRDGGITWEEHLTVSYSGDKTHFITRVDGSRGETKRYRITREGKVIYE